MCKTIIVEEISKEDAKVKIKEWFDKHLNESIYPDEIADQLHIDFQLVMTITSELIDEKFIEIDEKFIEIKK